MSPTQPSNRSLLRRLRYVSAIVLALAGTLTSACATEAAGDTPPLEELDISCTGKCDGLERIKSFYKRSDDVDLNDLASLGVGFATDGLNDALEFDGTGAELTEPAIYALPEVAEGDLTVKNIDELVSGLTTRFGESELTTEVNRLRAAHLRSSSDRFFAESAFRLNLDLDNKWDIGNVGGFEDSNAWVGLLAGASVQGRVVQAFQDELASYATPIEAAKALRGFVLPRSLGEIRDMKPGELVALRGEGRIGFNFGAGVPILVAEPVSALTYSLVLSASARTQLSGSLDIQLVRLSGDEVVLDVGLSRADLRAFRIALEGGWGVAGLVASNVRLGGVNVDLGKLADRALRKQLNKHLNFLSAEYERTREESRLSIVRLRFALDTDNESLEQALAQAMRGDLRLAQSLGERPESGVKVDFDLSRSGVSTTSRAGLNLFGMKFFTQTIRQSGEVTVTTPGGTRALLFDSLRRESGSFFSTHGFQRVGLAGMIYDPRGMEAARGETNLFIQAMEGDDYLEREKLLDHLDALIQTTAGDETIRALADAGNRLDLHVTRTCNFVDDSQRSRCRLEVLEDPMVIALRAEATAAVESEIAGLPTHLQDLTRRAAALRLAASSTYEVGGLAGPAGNVLLDYRIDDSALESLLTQHTGDDLEAPLHRYARRTMIGRTSDTGNGNIGQETAYRVTENVLGPMAEIFDDVANRYQQVLAAEAASIEGLGQIGARAIEIRIPKGDKGGIDYENATAQTLPQARAALVMELFDRLREEAKDLHYGPESEQVVAYLLLSMLDPDELDVRFDANFDFDAGGFWRGDVEAHRRAGWATQSFYAHGPGVDPIEGGMFDIASLIDLNR